MAVTGTHGDATAAVAENGVVTVEIHRPPNNFFDVELIAALSEIYEAVDADLSCRAIVLCAEGKHFCAGANFAPQPDDAPPPQGAGIQGNNLYSEAARLIDSGTPVIAAVHGAAIGGGLGLACSADFRVGCAETRMAANFAQLGFHHGFGLTITLPPIIGQQKALDMLLTGRRVPGQEAYEMGLLDRFVPLDDVRSEALGMAAEIASSAPLAVSSIRSTMRDGLGARYRKATDHENAEQARLRQTKDFREGVKATAERRPPNFSGS